MPDLSGHRLGRSGGDPTEIERVTAIDEMSVELLKSGSLYVWFALQFWGLRFAATNLFVRVR
eukprot:5259338-Heterocapsa_arctica.AAC.1